MTAMLTPDSPCRVEVIPSENGGVHVELFIPTYEGGARFALTAERDNDGDWRLFVPHYGTDRDVQTMEAESGGFYEVCNGIIYLGAPDVEVEERDR
jgi:hypothetical protein